MTLNYKEADSSVNVSKVSPIKRFIQVLLGILVALVALYVLLGLVIDVIAPHIPISLEMELGDVILSEWTVVDNEVVLEKYETILATLIGEGEADNYHIYILEEDMINALAIPGNIIGITTEFVEEIEDEEMIAFALAHELGHFENRDHIKSYGRFIVLYGLLNALEGGDLFLDVLLKTEMKFSQKGELAADAYGATLVEAVYGSSQGGIDFFKRMNELTEESPLESYFDSHPHPEKRIKVLENRP